MGLVRIIMDTVHRITATTNERNSETEMKKAIMALITMVAIIITSVFPVFAATDRTIQYKLMTTEELAYCEIEAAPVEVRADILAARDAIIHSTSWTVDGQVAVQNEDGTIQELPEFSELFPGWDVPTIQGTENNIMLCTVDYFGFVYLRHPTSTKTLPFYAAFPSASGITLEIQPRTLPGSSWNGAFTNVTTGQEIGYVNSMPITKTLLAQRVSTRYCYGARASTFSTEGDALMYVHEIF